MATTPDFGQMMKDAMGNLPVDTKAVETFVKSQSALAEKMSAVAIEAAQKSTDLSARWAQDTLSKLSGITQAKVEPADYAKSMSDFMRASAEAASGHMAAFAEIAKKVQTETLELMLAAGKDMGADMQEAARKAGTDVTNAMQNGSTNV